MATVSSGILSAAALFLRANIMWNNIQNSQKYLRFSVTDGIIYFGKHQKYNLLHSIPPYPAGCGTPQKNGRRTLQ